MRYAEFKRQVSKAGLKIHEFAALIDVQPSSISTYANSEIPKKYAVLAVLLAEAVEHKLSLRELLANADIPWPIGHADKKVTDLAEYRVRAKREDRE